MPFLCQGSHSAQLVGPAKELEFEISATNVENTRIILHSTLPLHLAVVHAAGSPLTLLPVNAAHEAGKLKRAALRLSLGMPGPYLQYQYAQRTSESAAS